MRIKVKYCWEHGDQLKRYSNCPHCGLALAILEKVYTKDIVTEKLVTRYYHHGKEVLKGSAP